MTASRAYAISSLAKKIVSFGVIKRNKTVDSAATLMTDEKETGTNREMSDFASDCNQWGRYNVHYLEPDGEQRTAGSGNNINVTHPCSPGGNSDNKNQPLRSKMPSANETGGARSIKRHGSDAGTRNKSMKNRNRVSRRQSEGPAGAMAARCKQHSSSGQQDGLRLGSSTSCLEPCLRLSIIHRHESDLRKKRVAFSDAPAVVWNDPPVILFSAGNNNGRHPAPHSSALASNRRHSYPSNSLLAGGNNAEGSAGPATLKDGRAEEYQEQGEEILTPKERRRKKVVMAVVCTTFILLMASALFVLISLFHASAIDEAGTFIVFYTPPSNFLSVE